MYEILSDMNLLFESFKKCKKGVSWKCSVQRYEANLLHNLNELKKELENHTYKITSYNEFTVSERGKTRHIKSPIFKDRIVQKSICNYILEPILYRYLIYDNGACIKGKGVEFTRKRLDKNLYKYYKEENRKEGYILICDYKDFFGSIPHDKLLENLSKHIKDKYVMDIIKQIVYSFNDTGKGLGIGSEISQILGVWYPTPIDNFCKIIKRCKYYGRHMDDFYIIHNDKIFLKNLLIEIEEESKKLGLELNKEKTQIYKIDKGFKYLKQNIFIKDKARITHKPYKKNIVRERRKLKSFKIKLNNKELKLVYIKNCYKSWRNDIEKYNSIHIINNMDNLFYDLFKEQYDN